MMKKNNMAQNKRNGKTDGKLNFIRRKKQQATKKVHEQKIGNFSFNLHSFSFIFFLFFFCYSVKFQLNKIS